MKRLVLVIAVIALGGAACSRGPARDPRSNDAMDGRGAGVPPCRDVPPDAACEVVAASELPEPVLAAVRSHQRASIASASKLTRAGRVVYDLRLTGTRKTHLVVEPDGRVITFE